MTLADAQVGSLSATSAPIVNKSNDRPCIIRNFVLQTVQDTHTDARKKTRTIDSPKNYTNAFPATTKLRPPPSLQNKADRRGRQKRHIAVANGTISHEKLDRRDPSWTQSKMMTDDCSLGETTGRAMMLYGTPSDASADPG